MEPKKENEAAFVRPVVYEPLSPSYKPYNPTNKQKRKLERLLRKKRS